MQIGHFPEHDLLYQIFMNATSSDYWGDGKKTDVLLRESLKTVHPRLTELTALLTMLLYPCYGLAYNVYIIEINIFRFL